MPTPTPALRLAIRAELGEAAESLQRVVGPEKVSIVGEVDGTYTVRTKRKQVHQVIGVWLDPTRAGENLYEGQGDTQNPDGSFNEYTGIITLSSNYDHEPLTEVYVWYVHREGMTDDVIDHQFNMAIGWIMGQLNITDYNSVDWSYDSTSYSRYMFAAIAVTQFFLVLNMNGAGVIQQGYNFRIEEFQVESKAWGEGMIAQFLLEKFYKKAYDAMEVLGWGTRFAKSSAPSIQVSRASYQAYKLSRWDSFFG